MLNKSKRINGTAISETGIVDARKPKQFVSSSCSLKPTKTEKIMTAEELFEKLEHTGNHYSSFYIGRKYVYFSTGGWSENEDLIRELRKTFIFKMLLVEWKCGGHYKFKKLRMKSNEIKNKN